MHGQAIGALVQGLGGVFLEHLVYDQDAQILNASLADYTVPLASDLRTITMELRRSKTNPLGAKGAGDGGMVAATAANAVAAALKPLGVDPRELPLSPALLWKIIKEKGKGG